MKQLKQWITWRIEPRPGEPKPAKVPFDPATGRRSSPMDPATWMTHAEALATGHSIGFVFTEADPYFFFDLDGCHDGQQWDPVALALVHRFPGAFVEVSHSNRGMHVFGRYSGPRPIHGTRGGPGLELYTADRFVAMGTYQSGDVETDCTASLNELIISHFPRRLVGKIEDWTTEPVDEWTGLDDDDELILKARAPTGSLVSLFGGDRPCPFEALWTADESELSVFCPSATGDVFDRSKADITLAHQLAFWTGKNCERIERLMRSSELVRSKWEREAYLEGTILKGVAGQAKVYDYVKPVIEGVGPQQYQFMSIQDQALLFKGCIYIVGPNKVMVPDGQLLGKDQFNALMPNSEFARDATGTKTTRKPWEAFNESLGMRQPLAATTCFDPLQPWDVPISEAGQTYANTYRPINTPRKAGDPAPFLGQLRVMLPDERDRAILLAYMAAVVQHKGAKFYWAPVIQGVAGNGKSMVTLALQHALGAHFGRASGTDLANKFNGWIADRLLIGIEDARVSELAFEAIKPLVTDTSIAIQRKGQEQETRRSCANFIFTTNHRDGIPKTRDDRRFAVFFTAQQQKSDVDAEQVGAVYDWLNADGYAIVHEFLHTYAIPDELNPATQCKRAPDTSTVDDVIVSSLGATEQEVLDWIDEGRSGFRRPWVSRTMLKEALRDQHNRMAPSRQREILHRLGYVPHPAMVGPNRKFGRTNNPVLPDHYKAELWVVKDHPAAQLATNTAVARAYEETQALVQATQVFNVQEK